MNLFDKIAAAIRPEETAEDRIRARNNALALAQDGDWLALAIQHHREIEALFAEALGAVSPDARIAAMRQLGHMLSAHSMAEEVVLYPALALGGEKTDAAMAYEEQAMTKVEMAALEKLDPHSDAWREKLESIRAAVSHHVFQEEGEWFPRLQATAAGDDAHRLTRRFEEEFARHSDVAQGGILAAHHGADGILQAAGGLTGG